MNTPLLFTLAISLLATHAIAADEPAPAGPRFPAQAACFNGKVDAGSVCEEIIFQPGANFELKGTMTCGFVGKVSKIDWEFVERREGKDVYRFTRRFPFEEAKAKTTTKTVEFSDARVVVFEDKSQVIVIEPVKP